MLSLLLAAALAQPVTPNCTPSGVCRVRELRASSARINGALTIDGGVTAASFTATATGAGTPAYNASSGSFWSIGGGCTLGGQANSVTVGPYNACTMYLPGKAASASYIGPAYFVLGMSGALIFDNVTTAASLVAPATAGNALAGDTARVWKSNASRWTELQGAPHPTTQSPPYSYVMDRAAGANAPAWAYAPRSGAASVAFTTAGTLTSGTTTWSENLLTLATSAVSGNQAHHSTAVFTGPAARWSARVGVNGLASVTSLRAFFGLSATLPITAGSSTPSVDAAVFRADTSIGANWYACTSDGSAGLSCTDTGVAIASPASTEISATLEIDCREGDATGVPAGCTFWINGRAYVRRTSSMPNAAVGSTVSVETLTAASRSVQIGTAVTIEPQLRATP